MSDRNIKLLILSDNSADLKQVQSQLGEMDISCDYLVYQSFTDTAIDYGSDKYDAFIFVMKSVSLEDLYQITSLSIVSGTLFYFIGSSFSESFIRAVEELPNFKHISSAVPLKTSLIDIVHDCEQKQIIDEEKKYSQSTDFQLMDFKSVPDSEVYQNLFNNLPVIVVGFDLQNKLVIWNKKTEELSHYQAKDIVDKETFIKTMLSCKVHEDDIEVLKKIENVNGHLHTKSGEIIEVVWNIAIIKGDDGRKIELWSGLEQRDKPGEMTGKLLDHFGNLISDLHHQSQLLFSKSGRSKQIKTVIGQVQSKIDYFQAGLDMFMALNRGINLEPKQENLTEMIENVLVVLKTSIPENIMIETDYGLLDYVLLDSIKTERAINNVVVNAIEAMPDGGKLFISTQSIGSNSMIERFKILPSEPTFAQITVENTKSSAESTFLGDWTEPFCSDKDSMIHQGLGLFESKIIMHSHDGYLKYTTTDQKTIVDLLLPISVKSTISKSSDVDQQIIDKKEKLVLVVDDEDIIRELIQDVLISNDFKVITARDGVEGLQQYKEHITQIDLVILDIIMPGMDGKELYAEIKKIKPDAKVLVTSGYSKPKVKEELMQSGVKGFLPKPFNILELTSQLQKLL